MNYVWVVVLIGILGNSDVCAKTISEYKTEIKSKSQELDSMRRSLDEKKAEKEKCLRMEKDIKKELESIEDQMHALAQKGVQLKKSIKQAQENLKRAERDMMLAGGEKQQWKDILKAEMNLWYRGHASYFRIVSEPVLERLRFDAMLKKREYITNAELKEHVSKTTHDKWSQAQERLVSLKEQLEKTVNDQQDIKQKKEALLQTATGKRLAAEQEIKELSTSADALRKLIHSLEKEKKKTEAEIQATKAFRKKRGHLPWPVTGEVTTKFGKNKHPELDTYVISNGIKIRTKKNTAVTAVGNGEVIFCGSFRAYGQMIIVDHGGSFYTIYGHLGDMAVEEGARVQAGDTIGTVNGNGSAESYLYFEVRSGSAVEDPLLWLK